MARAGRKTLWEDDVRALLGMQQPESAAAAADTSLEKAFSISKPKDNVTIKMTHRADGKLYETLEEGSTFAPARRMLLVLLFLVLLIAGVIMIAEEAGQATNATNQKKHAVLHPRRGAGRIALRHGIEDEPVSKQNWKHLQREADEERKRHAKGTEFHAKSADEEQKDLDRVEKDLDNMGSKKISTDPHTRKAPKKDYGAGIFNW